VVGELGGYEELGVEEGGEERHVRREILKLAPGFSAEMFVRVQREMKAGIDICGEAWRTLGNYSEASDS